MAAGGAAPGKRRVDISDWVETQNKDFAPSSLDRYLYHPESPNGTSSPRWDAATTTTAASSPSSSSYVLSPSLLRQLSAQYTKGEMVAVRCNRHKWLLGEVKRLSQRGVRVWVGEAGLLVNVPKQLLSTHLFKMSSSTDGQSLPPPEPGMLITQTDSDPGRALVHCVRPAHLSHRRLYLVTGLNTNTSSGSGGSSGGSSCCAICGDGVINEDEAVAPWDCQHSCHIDCIQDKPKFFSTTTCPICKDGSSSVSSSSVSPSSPDAAFGKRSWTPPHKASDDALHASNPSASSSAGPMRTIDEDTPQLRSPAPARTGGLKSAMRKHSVSFSIDAEAAAKINAAASASASAASTAPSAGSSSSSSSATTLADRMKKFAMPSGSSGNQQQQQQEQTPWVTVIQDGQNTRHTASQQRIEHMARAKENTFSAKAKQQQQQQQKP